MKKIMLSLVVIAMLVSCNSKKNYKYVETYKDTDLNALKEESAVVLKSENDTLAYFMAYQKYSYSLIIVENMVKNYGSYHKVPVSFKLFNTEGKDISNIQITNKAEREKKEYEKALQMYKQNNP